MTSGGSDRADWDAHDYVAHSAAQQLWARELIEKLRLRGDEAVLDIGCGDGRATAMIAERLPDGSALGVDSSPSMIAKAREQFPPPGGGRRAGPANLIFRLLDARALDLPPAFDVAFSTAALHWIPDHEAILRGVRAALLPGGRLLFQMGGRGNITEALAVMEEVMGRPRWRSYFAGFVPPHHFFGPEEYEVWLPAAGLALTRVELFPRDMPHAGRAAFVGWLRTTWFPYIECVPPELAAVFLDEVADAYEAAHPPDEDGVYRVRLMRLEVEATAIAAGIWTGVRSPFAVAPAWSPGVNRTCS